MSVDLEQLLIEDGLARDVLYPSFDDAVALVALPIVKLRESELAVEHEPVKQNWYHGGVNGTFSKKVRTRIKDVAVDVIEIDQVKAHSLRKTSVSGEFFT